MNQPDPRSADQADPLLPGLAAGQAEAFEALYERYGERMYRTALGLVGRAEDAEDAVQETFVSLVRSHRRLGSVEDLGAYVFAALRHAAVRVRARRGRDLAMGLAAAQNRPSGGGIPDPWDAERLGRAIQDLPAEQREVITLRVQGELTFAQIAQASGVSINTIMSRYRYAIAKLRGVMAEEPS